MRRLLIALTALACLAASPADARHKARHYKPHVAAVHVIICNQWGCSDRVAGNVSEIRQKVRGRADTGPRYSAGDPRPRKWCAWWLRRHLNIPRTAFKPYEYNLARAFVSIGSPAPMGCTGCIAVFSRGKGGHVGIVESWDANGNPVLLSGNVNGRVQVAVHQKSRLIALRWVT